MHWLSTLPENLRALALQWQALQPLPEAHARQLGQRLRIEWNYNSNHIEGNTLTYGETLLLLIHGRTRGDHLMREYEEMRGHDVAIELVRTMAQDARPLTEGDVRDINRIVLKEGFWRVAQTPDGEPTRKWIEPGRYKISANHVLTSAGEIFQFVAPEATPAAMSEFLAWLVKELATPSLPLPTLLARAHHEFIRIHPFDDGNGRVVRLLLNYVLLRAGLLPIVVKSLDRQAYLAAIALADAGELEPLATYFETLIAWSLALGIRAAGSLIELHSDT
jgi:Fic family protein